MVSNGNAFPEMVKYRKDCDCPAGVTATSGRLVCSTESDAGETIIRVTLYPGPVCDGCDKPWRQVTVSERLQEVPGSPREGDLVSKIKPALTAEEWANGYEGSDVAIFLATGGRLHVNVLSHPLGGSMGDPRDLPALAALCLHEQPFGFTLHDVDMLRQGARSVLGAEEHRTLLSLADRIESLLPPEESEGKRDG